MVTVLATLMGYAFFVAGLRDANIIMIYILGVLVTAIWTRGHLYGAFASLMSVLAFNFFLQSRASPCRRLIPIIRSPS